MVNGIPTESSIIVPTPIRCEGGTASPGFGNHPLGDVETNPGAYPGESYVLPTSLEFRREIVILFKRLRIHAAPVVQHDESATEIIPAATAQLLLMTTPAEPIRYAAGAHVRVRVGSPAHHFRTPAYIQGHTGVVDALCGVYPNPESLAHSGDGLPRQPLYRIRLRQTDLWPDYAGNPADILLVDVYQHWLEPA